MSAGWIIFLALGAIATGSLLWLGWMWLAKSWEILDEDQLSARLPDNRHSRLASAIFWLRMRGWLGRKPRELAYRRDKSGRFRRIRR